MFEWITARNTQPLRFADKTFDWRTACTIENLERHMTEGTIKRITTKGFGFIDDGTGNDTFFHSSSVEGTTWEQLQEGQKVSFNIGQGPKGPRAENVRVL